MSDVAGDFRRQLPSMIGMAGMFVATIFLAMYIRPWYDKAGLQAFGEAGASQLRYIGLELLMIFIFTAAILLLAKYKKEWVIKYGIMGILFIALLYASIPLAHQILVDDSITPFEYESTEETEATYLTEIGMDQYLDTIRSNQSGELINTIRLMQWGVEEPIWSTDILHGNVSYEFSELIVVPGPDWVTINTGAVINTLSLTDGSIVSTYDCFYYDNQGDLRPLVEAGCILVTEIEDALYIVDAGERLHRFNIDREDYPNQLTLQQKQATWQLPPDMKAVDVLVEAELLSDTSLLIVSEEYAGVVRLNKSVDEFPDGGIYEPAHILIEASSEAGFTSADVGYSNLLKVPMNESTTGEQLIVLGTEDGDIHSWSFEPTASTDSSDTYRPDTLKKESGGSIEGFASEIRDVRLTDYDHTGFTELLVTTGDDARLLWSSTLIQKLIVDVPEGEDVVVAFGMTSQDAEDDTNHLHATVINGTYVTSSGVVEESMELVGGLVIEDIPTIIGLLVSLLLMILLYVHSEWYVVNTVGILVGSGVIVMLGVSFVPTLIMVFMIAAAVYDAWAVYKSKHMLDLADTMMNLNLPILLVAPQDSEYSMRTERTTVHDAVEEVPRDAVQQASRERVVAKSNDAMLMGLGDVIFPGMLVLSTLQYVGGDNGLIMAMTTLVGSLIGYSVLMYYVGKGQAQAGLPLLNGGAILGYIVGGLLTIGMAMFQFNISF